MRPAPGSSIGAAYLPWWAQWIQCLLGNAVSPAIPAQAPGRRRLPEARSACERSSVG